MKKALATVLMLVLAFCMAGTVAADSNDVSVIEKGWVDESGEVLSEGEYPETALEFVIVRKSARDYTNAAYATEENIPDLVFGKEASASDITVSGVENISGVGIFTYTIKENDPLVAGVEVNTSEFKVEIMRSYKMVDGKATSTIETAYATVLPVSGTDVKPTAINNTYVDGNLTLTKKVTGNLSYENEKFTIELKFVSDKPVETDITLPNGSKVSAFEKADGKYVATAEIEISASNGRVTVSGIPKGVSVTVAEKDSSPYELVGYSVGNTNKQSAPTVVMTADGVDVVITNNYSTEIDTGISLDSLPYILILGAVVAVGTVLIVKKRRNAADAD